MKKTLFLILACCNFLQAEEIPTKFLKPLDIVHLDSPWKVTEKEKFVLIFEHNENEDIQCTIFQGLLLKKRPSFIELADQLDKSQGVLAKAPLFIDSYPYIEDEAQVFDWTLTTIHNLETLILYSRGEMVETTQCNDEEEITTVTYLKQITYIIALENRLYAITFSAPEELFDEQLIADTLHALLT